MTKNLLFKWRLLFAGVCVGMTLFGCRDSAYDLSKVNEDGSIVIGNELSGPLGSLQLSTDDKEFPDVNGIVKDIALPELSVSITMPYPTPYAGPLPNEIDTFIEASSDLFDVTCEEIEIDSVLLREGTLQMTLHVDNFETSDTGAYIMLMVTLPEGYLTRDEKTNAKLFERRTFSELLEDSTYVLDLYRIMGGKSQQISCGIKMYLPAGAEVVMTDMPVFRISPKWQEIEYEALYGKNCWVSDTIKDVFDEDIIDLFFDDSVTLLGTITNGLSFDFRLMMVITDSIGHSLISSPPAGTPLEYIPPIPSGGTFESALFTIETQEDIDTMQRARHLVLTVQADTVLIKPEETVTFDLRFKKAGGLDINKL